MLFEDAKRDRKNMYENMERDLIGLLSINEVRRIGDRLDYIEWYSSTRHYIAATAALEELYYRVPKSALNNSAALALETIGRLKEYPEAEYWIGEVYRYEGELSLALMQYWKAHEIFMRNKGLENFENTGFGTDLLYKIAKILLIRQEYQEMIRVLDSIINEHDTLWRNTEAAALHTSAGGNPSAPVPYEMASASFASNAMTRILAASGFNRIMELYRYNNSMVEKAHRSLGLHYAATGRNLTAQRHLMFAFLIQNTIIIEEIMRRKFDFTYTDITALTPEINRNPLLSSYVQEVEYYKTAYYLAVSLFHENNLPAARNLWASLAAIPEAGEWQNRSSSQLRNPQGETLIIMP